MRLSRLFCTWPAVKLCLEPPGSEAVQASLRYAVSLWRCLTLVVVLASAGCLVAAASASQPTQTFTGTITDDMCVAGSHAQMRMGPTDADCTTACVIAHGAEYVLRDGRDVYRLTDQQRPEAYAGQRVRIAGTLDAKTKTIRVESIAAAR